MTRLVLAVLWGSVALLAQTASLAGRVLDASGAAVPGAVVKLHSLDTGQRHQTLSDGEGRYGFSLLLPGRYEAVFSKTGFNETKLALLELIVQQVARYEAVLNPGSVAESITVSSAQIVLDTDSSTVGQVVGNQQIKELPLLGRNPYALAMLVPGVRPSSGTNNLSIDQISSVSYSVNGQRANANEFLLDGAPNTAASQNQPVVSLNPDAVQEFKVETNNFSAKYGRAAGGVFNVISRSGSNEVHFSVYEFFRNDKLNANDWFANRTGRARPPLRLNQFGGSIGGPVIRDKTFFFANAELVRFAQGVTFLSTLPSPEQLAGDFRNTRNAAGARIIMYDPYTTQGTARAPFPDNSIPASRIDPVSRRMLSFFPAPNTAGNPVTGVNNYARTDANQVNKDTWSVRMDHNLNSANRLFGRFSTDETPFLRASPYGPDNTASPALGPQTFVRTNAIVEHTRVFSPSLLMSVRYSATRLSNNRVPYSNGFDMTTLGLPASLRDAPGHFRSWPGVNITGISTTASIPNVAGGTALGMADGIIVRDTTHAMQGNMTWTRSRHTLEFGGEMRVSLFNNVQGLERTFSFTPAWTQGPVATQASTTGGFGLATFLLGVPSGNLGLVPAMAQRIGYSGLFLQDTFRLNAKLTLHAGLRYDYETPRTDRFDQLANFDYSATPPLRAPGFRSARSPHLSQHRRPAALQRPPRPQQLRSSARSGIPAQCQDRRAHRRRHLLRVGLGHRYRRRCLRSQRLSGDDQRCDKPGRFDARRPFRGSLSERLQLRHRQPARSGNSAGTSHRLFRPRQPHTVFGAVEL